jgi:hypothetical protein
VVFLDVVVGDVPVSEEVLDLEGVELLLVLDDLHWPSFPLLGDEGDWRSLFEDADFWHHELDLPGEFVHEVELVEEGHQELLLPALGEFGLVVGERHLLDDLVLVDDDLLAEVASAALVVELVNYLMGEVVAGVGVVLVYDVSQLHVSVKINIIFHIANVGKVYCKE